MNCDFEPVQVECYSGYKANERPMAFTFRNQRRKILEILDQWYEGGIEPEAAVVNYFKVKADDGTVFLLRYAADSDTWGACGYESIQ
jgi:hypothetical protein